MAVPQHTIATPTELIIDTIFGQYLIIRLRVMRLILNIIFSGVLAILAYKSLRFTS